MGYPEDDPTVTSDIVGGAMDDGAAHRILFVAESNAMFQGLVQATRQSLPGYLPTITQSLPADSRDIALVLIYGEAFSNLLPTLIAARERYANAAVVLLVDKATDPIPSLDRILNERLVQGILTLNQSFKIWIAALWLLLNGGEYLPASLVRRNFRWNAPAEPPAMEERHETVSPELMAAVAEVADDLTRREHEVLNYLSEGCQNKIIAARMSLSEHTVKVHVHNIIRKLRVHNRTQAANSYLTDAGRRRPETMPHPVLSPLTTRGAPEDRS